MEDLKTPWELFGVECGEGWFPLIEPILQYIQSYNKDKAEEYQIVVYQNDRSSRKSVHNHLRKMRCSGFFTGLQRVVSHIMRQMF